MVCATFRLGGQTFEVSFQGVKPERSPSNTFIISKTGNESVRFYYLRGKKYIQRKGMYSSTTILDSVNGEHLKIKCWFPNLCEFTAEEESSPLDIAYIIDLYFVGNKVFISISDVILTYSDGKILKIREAHFPGDPGIYSSEGLLQLPEIKEEVERHLSLQVDGLLNYLRNGSPTDTDW